MMWSQRQQRGNKWETDETNLLNGTTLVGFFSSMYGFIFVGVID